MYENEECLYICSRCNLYIYAGERRRLDEKPPKALWRFHLNSEWETECSRVSVIIVSFFLRTCDCGSQCIMSVPMQMKTEAACALCVCVCERARVPVGACLHVCVYKGLAHPTIRSFATTHTDRCEDWREREPRLWSTASLSKYYSHSPNFCLSLSFSLSFTVCLSLGFLCILSFPLCQTQRASLLFRVGNATGAKSALLSV